MNFDVETRRRGLGHAARIQRWHEPEQWREQLEAIADPAERTVATEYLRSIALRRRHAAQMRSRRAP